MIKYFYKRFTLLLFVFILACFCCLSACVKKNNKTVNVADKDFYGLTVNYIDVGDGDSAFITFPDGKNLLIDCGEDNSYNRENVVNVIENSNSDFTSKQNSNQPLIDYLILSHVDSDHTGNAKRVIERFGVRTAYVPRVDYIDSYLSYKNAYQTLVDTNTEIKITQYFDKIVGEDYCVAFLSPKPFFMRDSEYVDFNRTDTPSRSAINKTSAVTLINYKGVNFLFMADADREIEQKLLDNYKVGLYQSAFKDYFPFTLENIDFLKVGHHGAEDCSCYNFLSLTNPKNAIFSCGGKSAYHPSSIVLARFLELTPECNIYRTDYYGNISVYVDGYGHVEVKTSSDKK